MRLYKNYDEMLKQEGLEAVVIASVTTVHAEQAIKAIEANLHVLCEKPLSTSVEVVSHVASMSLGPSVLVPPDSELKGNSKPDFLANRFPLPAVTIGSQRCKREAPPESYVRIFPPF